MPELDDVTVKTIDRYRRAYDKADGAAEESPPSYRETAAWLLDEFVRFGRLAWAVTHPLRPLSSEALIDAGKTGVEELHELLPELKRFGQAILTEGDPSRLGEVTGLGARVQQERVLFKEAMREMNDHDTAANARHFAWVLQTCLRMLDAGVRRTILDELHAALARE